MKTKSLYIYADRKGAGSLIVTLGLMEMLKKNFQKVAFFRPIVLEKEDYDCSFIKEYFHLDIPKEKMYGFTLQEAHHIIATQGESKLYELLIQKQQQLQKEYDFIFCEGIYSELFANIVELDINIEIAKNFSSNVLTLINAKEESLQDIKDTIQLQEESLKKAGITKIATIINRVQPEYIQELTEKQNNIFTIVEHTELTKLSLADIIEHKAIRKFRFSHEDHARKINNIKVAAMSLDNFLEHIEQNDLIIFPADRSEILLGVLGSFYSRNLPSISGIVFSYDLLPHKNILKLIDGLENFSIPIFTTSQDTYTTANIISKIDPKIRTTDKQKISQALGIFSDAVDIATIESKLEVNTNEIITPQMFEYKLFEYAKRSKKTIVLPEAHDPRILRAAEIVLNRDIADIILLSQPNTLHVKTQQLGLDLSKATVIDPSSNIYIEKFANEFYNIRKHKGISYEQAKDTILHVNYFATMMVHMGYADGMVSGATHTTAETVRPALEIIKTKKQDDIVSSIFFMCLDTKVLVFGDCAIVRDPTASQLASIAIAANDNAKKFGIEPKVAMISYSSGESGKGEDVQKVKEATLHVKQRRPDICIDGPIQFDAAFDSEVAKKKLPNSKVAGKATIYIFPDLNTGNTTYKAVQRSSGAVAIGPILQGLKKPINDLSRGCLIKDIINTIAITAIQAQEEF